MFFNVTYLYFIIINCFQKKELGMLFNVTYLYFIIIKFSDI